MNKFLSELVLDTEDPQQVNVVITSSNFNATSYPSNSKHLWVVRCHHDFIFNLRILNFEVENEFDGLNFYDLSEGSRRLISEASGLGTTETNTNNLLMVFKPDCDSNFSGFRAVLTAVEKNIAQETTSSVSDLPKTTQSILETSTYSSEKTTKFYGTTEINTTTLQEGTSVKMTTPSNLQTTTSALGKLEVVEQDMFWAEARQFCISKHGDLIQKDPRILTLEGRKQIYEELGMQYDVYHTGIRRDQNNTNIFRRSRDGVQVSLEGWHSNGYPRSNDGYDFLCWYFHDNSNKNTVYNSYDYQSYFICEY